MGRQKRIVHAVILFDSRLWEGSSPGCVTNRREIPARWRISGANRTFVVRWSANRRCARGPTVRISAVEPAIDPGGRINSKIRGLADNQGLGGAIQDAF